MCLGGAEVVACSSSSSPETSDGGEHSDASHLDASHTDGARQDGHARSDAGTADGTIPDSGSGDGGQCQDAAVNFPSGCALGPQCEPLDLKCTGLYSDWATKTIAPSMHEYDPGLHLWSDGADKTRWISLPEGQPIDTSDMDEWTFPVNTKIFKQFVLEGNLVETRMLWKQAQPSEWYITTYHWSADLMSAPELLDGEPDADGHGYEIPDQSDCYDCHYGRVDNVMGFEAVALSSPTAGLALTGTTLAPLTLAGLVDAGWLTAAPPEPLVIPGSPTSSAALAYLHINCGVSCHNRGGGSSGTSFYMRLTVDGPDGGVRAEGIGPVAQTDTVTTGVSQPSGYFIPGEDASFVLDPHSTQRSAVYYRMSHRDGVDDAGMGTQMPPIATHKVDDAGVAAVGKWIEAGCGD
jgi:hypothetical protein